MQKEFHIVCDVRGRGLMYGLELVKNRKTKESAVAETLKFMNLTKDQGLLVGKGSLLGNVICIAPPLNISRNECSEPATKLTKVLLAMCC